METTPENTEELKKTEVKCAGCDNELMACRSPKGKGHAACPTLIRKDVLKTANNAYNDPVVHEFARAASIQEAACYVDRDAKPFVLKPVKTRIEEIFEFAKRMGYAHLGLAFCAGLKKEAAIVASLIESKGFKLTSAVCKAGRTPKSYIGVTAKDTIVLDDGESMCNPVFQAELMNHEKTDFNILLGLCVGHDSLFFKYAEAPTTVLAVKDRVTGHNPLAPIYLHESYYQKITR